MFYTNLNTPLIEEANFADLWCNYQILEIKLFLVFSPDLLSLEKYFLVKIKTGVLCPKSQGDSKITV